MSWAGVSPRVERLVAIDLGDKRTGLAVGDTETKFAAPDGLLEIPIDRSAGQALLDALVAAVNERGGPNARVIMGLPINMDGTDGPRAKLVRRFAARLVTQLGRPIEVADERRTSIAADERLARTGMTHGQKKRRRDAIAAAELLQAVLDGRVQTEVVPVSPQVGDEPADKSQPKA